MDVSKISYFLIFPYVIGRVYSLDCVSPVSFCPCSKEEWEKRSSQYNCTDLQYTCILTINNTLVEACIYDHPIKPAAPGCPFVTHCVESNGIKLPTIAIESDFKPCLTNTTGCPPYNHTGYSLTKLYQFPVCLRRDASSLCSNKSDTLIEEDKTGLLKIALGVLVPICVLALLVAIIYYLRKRNRNRRWKANRSFYFHKDYIPAPTHAVEYYGERLLLLSGNSIANFGECRDWLTRAKNELPGEINSVINYMDKDIGSTPLSEAISWGKKDVVALLLMKGADCEILNEVNDNPIQQALFVSSFVFSMKQHVQATVNFLEKLLATSDHFDMSEAKFNRFKDVVQKVIFFINTRFGEIPLNGVGGFALTRCRNIIPKLSELKGP